MKLQELAPPQQSKQTARVFESYFSQSIDFDRLSRTQAKNMLNRVQGLIQEHRRQPEFHRSEQNPAYLKLIVMEQGLTERIQEAALLSEASEVQQAQVVLAAQDMVDKMQKMLEEVSAMQFKDLPALVDSIKNEVGQQQANQFNADATAALSGLMQNLQGSKQQLDAALGVVTGQDVGMPADMGMAADANLGAAADLDAAAADASADLEAGAADLEADDEEAAADKLDLGRGRR